MYLSIGRIVLLAEPLKFALGSQFIVETSREPTTVRDPSNPYQPSSITNHVAGAGGLSGVVLLILGALLPKRTLEKSRLKISTKPAINPDGHKLGTALHDIGPLEDLRKRLREATV